MRILTAALLASALAPDLSSTSARGSRTPHDPDAAVRKINDRIEKDRSNAELYLQRGSLLLEGGRASLALSDFNLCLELQSRWTTAHLGRALALLALHRHEAALGAAKRFVALRPNHVHGVRTLARALAAVGDAEASARRFEQILDLPTTQPTAADFRAAAEAWSRVGAEGVRRARAIRDRAAASQTANSNPSAQPQRAKAPASVLSVLAMPPLRPRSAIPLVGTTLVAKNSPWRYFDQGTTPAGWNTVNFDASSWAAGVAPLGYGDTLDQLRIGKHVVGYGPSATNKYITTYFRHPFQLGTVPNFRAARLRIQHDDGAVVYLNGQELVRSNMPQGPITKDTLAIGGIGGCLEWAHFTYLVDPSTLRQGLNVLAVEIHQFNAASSDIVFDLDLYATTGATALERGPYLQRGAPDSAVVRWRTDFPSDTAVWLGTNPSQLTLNQSDPNAKLDHEVVIRGLRPDTTYYYAVGNAAGVLAGGDNDHRFRTPPTAGTMQATRIWAIGDSGTGDALARAVRDGYTTFVGNKPADVWLMLGDNAYNRGTDIEYQRAVFDTYPDQLKNMFVWPTYGNHEWFTADSTLQCGVYYDVFTLPKQAEAGGVPSNTEAYYSFDHGDIHFVCLDSFDSDRPPIDLANPAAHKLNPNGPMMRWLTADLAATNARWIIAYWHHPPYTKGSHDSDFPLEPEHGDMRSIVLPELEKAGVDLVLSGHSHSYERSFLLNGHYGLSNTLQRSMKIDAGNGNTGKGGDGSYVKPTLRKGQNEGAVYVVAGSSGKISGGPLNHPAMLDCRNELGSVVLDVDANKLVANFIDFQGQVRDRFIIEKGQRRTLQRDEPLISLTAGGSQQFTLDVGPAHANKDYILLGSFGTSPGFQVGGLQVPLNMDSWFSTTVALANSAVLPNSVGRLDAMGRAARQPSFNLPPLNQPLWDGLELFHAAIVGKNGSFDLVTNPVKVTLSFDKQRGCCCRR